MSLDRLIEFVRAGDVAGVRQMVGERPELAGMAVSYGDERQPIHFAVMARSPEIVRLLMRHGASARKGIHPHRDATTAWAMARDRGYDDVLAAIEEETQPQPAPAQRAEEEDPARDAVARGDADWLRARHGEGRLSNEVRWNGGGLLTVAVRHNRPDIVRLLLDYGFEPNEPVSYTSGEGVMWSRGYPLWYAAALGQRDMAEVLLNAGADPNVHVDSSGSPVYSAYSHKQWEMAEFLRQRGGVVTADIAAIYRQTDVARELLAEDTARDLLHYGAMGGALEVVRMALERIDWPRGDARWFGPLTEPLSFWHHIPWLYAGNREFDRAGYLDSFRVILDRSGPNITGGFNRTALHEVAAMGAHVSEAEAAAFAAALLQAGARTNVRDELLSSTPLGWACRWGRSGVVRVLVEHGADSVEEDTEAWARPMAWAARFGHPNVLASAALKGRAG